MRYISLFCFAIIMNCSLFFNVQASSAPNIVAIVNNTPITLQEFKARKQFLQFVNNAYELSPAAETQLNKTALKTLIDEQLFINEAKKFKVEVSEQEINQAIATIEKNNHMPKGHFVGKLKANGVSVDTLKQQIKAQLIKERFAYMLSHNVNINKKEVDEAAELANKETMLKFKKVIALQNDKQGEAKLSSLKKKIYNCQIEPHLYQNIAQVEDISLLENKMSEQLKSQSLRLKAGQSTDILKENDQLVFYVFCAKEISGIKEDEYDYIAHALENKKISIIAQRYYERLKRKSYIKVFLK